MEECKKEGRSQEFSKRITLKMNGLNLKMIFLILFFIAKIIYKSSVPVKPKPMNTLVQRKIINS